MKVKMFLTAMALTLAPYAASAMCGDVHASKDVVMSCAEGSVYDAETQKCVPTTG